MSNHSSFPRDLVLDDYFNAPMTSQDIQSDNLVRQSRDAAQVIVSKSDLTIQEKQALHDLLEEWCATRPSSVGHAQVVSRSLRNHLFELVFRGWDPDEDLNRLPTLHDKSLQEIAVPIGT